MDKRELINIIKKYYSYEDVLKDKLSIEPKEKYDLVVVSPTWKPHFVFNEEYKILPLKQGSTSTYKLEYKGKKILFIKTGKGAPNLYDNLLLLYNVESPYIFLGSTGSLKKDINIGDIVIPDYSISGDGATLYFEKELSNKLYQKVFYDETLKKSIKNICDEINIIVKNGSVYSTDTLIGEYYHINEIINMGVSCIEQETASFGKCMNIMDKKGLPILVVSDSVICGQNYYEPLENKKDYLETRTKKLQKIINKFY